MTATAVQDGAWTVGIDTGGTFVDLVVHPPGDRRVHTTKLPRDAGPERLVAKMLELGVAGDAIVVHGTTHVTNAILQGDFARAALVTTRGFADVLRIARQARDDLFDLHRPARISPVIPSELTFELDERLGPDGSVWRPLRDLQLQELVERVMESGVEAVAVCLLHSYANPEHELLVGEALGSRVAVSLSHQVSAEAREYERASATALNAALQHGMSSYLSAIGEALRGALPSARLFVVQSAGGMLPADTAGHLPLATVISGPAAGVAAAAHLARRMEVGVALTLDMGGTSTDVSLVLEGSPAVARDRTLAGHTVRMPAVAVESIAIGGGSVIAFDDVAALTVGPRSAGAVPGPACYDRGGIEPTITDAALMCGLIGAGGRVPGVQLRRDRAQEALERVGAGAGLSPEELAWRAVDVAQGAIASLLSRVASRRGYDMRDATLFAYGGGGPVHAAALAARTGIRRVAVPVLAPVLSALGCAVSEVEVQGVRTERCELVEESLAVLETSAEELAAALARRLGESPTRAEASRWLELRYRGQSSELAIPWRSEDAVDAVAQRFHSAHQREYAFSTPDPIEVTAVGCRLRVAGARAWPSPPPPTRRSTHPTESELILPGGDRQMVPVLEMEALAGGRTLPGPALIAAEFGSITVWHGQKARLDAEGTVFLEPA